LITVIDSGRTLARDVIFEPMIEVIDINKVVQEPVLVSESQSVASYP